MTAPSFSAKGTVATANYNPCDGLATLTVTYPATINSGDLLVLYVCGNCSAGSADVVTPTLAYNTINENGGGTTRLAGVYYRVANGTEGGGTETITVAFTTPTTGRALAQVYLIVSANTSSPIDGAAVITTGAAATSLTMPNLTPSAANSLAVAIVTCTSNTTITSSTGEAGGDWTEAAAEDGSAACGTVDMQTAGISGAISGGNAVSGISTTFRNIGFVVKEFIATGSSVVANINQAANRSSSY